MGQGVRLSLFMGTYNLLKFNDNLGDIRMALLSEQALK